MVSIKLVQIQVHVMKNYYIVSPKDRDRTMIRSLIVGNSHNMQITHKPKSPSKNQLFYQPHLTHRPSLTQNNIQNSHSNYSFKLNAMPMENSQLDQQSNISRPNQLKIQRSRYSSDLQEKIQQIVQRLSKQQDKLTLLQESIGSKINHFGNTMADKIIQETFNALKKPTIMKQILTASNFNHTMNAQIYEHLFNFKMDLQCLKDEVKKSMKSKEFETEVDKHIYEAIENNAKQRKRQLIDLETIFNKHFDTSFKKVQEQLKIQIQQNIKKVETQLIQKLPKAPESKPFDLLNPELQVSRLKYQLPPLMITYQNILKSQGQSDMHLDQYVYYIDCEGFLLDKNSYYIVTKLGEKIKVEESQLQLLKKNNLIR